MSLNKRHINAIKEDLNTAALPAELTTLSKVCERVFAESLKKKFLKHSNLSRFVKLDFTRKMVGRPRFERGTNGLKVRCSTS